MSPHIHQEQDVNESSLTPRHVIGQLNTIQSFLSNCTTTLIIDSGKKYTLLFLTKDILGQEKWANLSFYLRNMQVGKEIIDKDLFSVNQALDQLTMLNVVVFRTRLVLNDAKNEMNDGSDDTNATTLLLKTDLWSVVKDYLSPRTVEVNYLTIEQKDHFVKEFTRSSSANNASTSDYI